MYYITHSDYTFVDFPLLSPMVHIALQADVRQQTLCGQVYSHRIDAPYTRNICEICRVRGITQRGVRPGRFPYAYADDTLRWFATMADDISHFTEVVAVGPFATLDCAWWYVAHDGYASGILPSEVPMIRLARLLGRLASIYPIETANIRARPGGVHVTLTTAGALYTIIESLDTAAHNLGFGAMRVAIDRETGAWKITEHALNVVFPYGSYHAL